MSTHKIRYPQIDPNDMSTWPEPERKPWLCSEPECWSYVGEGVVKFCEECPDGKGALCPVDAIPQPDGTYLCRTHDAEVKR